MAHDWGGVARALSTGSQTSLARGSRRGEREVPLVTNPRQKIALEDHDRPVHLGSAVSLSADGSVAAIGAYGDSEPNGRLAGSVYIFESTGEGWRRQAKLVADDGDDRDRFGRAVSLSADGTVAAVGAPEDEGPNGDDAGSVYIFEYAAGSWHQRDKLTGRDTDSGDFFGYAVALSADGATVLVGAQQNSDPNGFEAGSAYVFSQTDGWSQEVKLVPDDGSTNDRFGVGVALSADGNTALVGAPGDMDNGRLAGSTYAFERSSAGWRQAAKFVTDDRDDDEDADRFGSAVALDASGRTALVGARGDDPGGGFATGSAYVFGRSEGGWNQRAKLVSTTGDKKDYFGAAVALSRDGRTAVIGAPNDEDPNGNLSGSAHLFSASSGSWSRTGKLAPATSGESDNLGSAVALSADGSTTLVGAPDADGTGSWAGAAYVFGRPGSNVVSGTVVDVHGDPIPGVGLRAFDVGERTELDATTSSEDGSFTLSSLDSRRERQTLLLAEKRLGSGSDTRSWFTARVFDATQQPRFELSSDIGRLPLDRELLVEPTALLDDREEPLGMVSMWRTIGTPLRERPGPSKPTEQVVSIEVTNVNRDDPLGAEQAPDHNVHYNTQYDLTSGSFALSLPQDGVAVNYDGVSVLGLGTDPDVTVPADWHPLRTGLPLYPASANLGSTPFEKFSGSGSQRIEEGFGRMLGAIPVAGSLFGLYDTLDWAFGERLDLSAELSTPAARELRNPNVRDTVLRGWRSDGRQPAWDEASVVFSVPLRFTDTTVDRAEFVGQAEWIMDDDRPNGIQEGHGSFAWDVDFGPHGHVDGGDQR